MTKENLRDLAVIDSNQLIPLHIVSITVEPTFSSIATYFPIFGSVKHFYTFLYPPSPEPLLEVLSLSVLIAKLLLQHVPPSPQIHDPPRFVATAPSNHVRTIIIAIRSVTP